MCWFDRNYHCVVAIEKGFDELSQDEMMEVDGGALFPKMMEVCEFLFVGGVSTTFGALGALGGGIGIMGAGYVGTLVGQRLWDLMFE